MAITYNQKAQRYQDTETGKFMPTDMGKFLSVLKSVENKILDQTRFVQNVHEGQLITVKEGEKQTTLLEKLVSLQSESNQAATEKTERETTAEKLSQDKEQEKSIAPRPVDRERRGGLNLFTGLNVNGLMSGFSILPKLLLAGAAGPLLYSFIKGAIDEFTRDPETGVGKFSEFETKLLDFGSQLFEQLKTIDFSELLQSSIDYFKAFQAVPWDKIANAIETISEWPILKIIAAMFSLAGAIKMAAGIKTLLSPRSGPGGLATGLGIGAMLKGISKAIGTGLLKFGPWATLATATLTPSKIQPGGLYEQAQLKVREKGLEETDENIQAEVDRILNSIPQPDENTDTTTKPKKQADGPMWTIDIQDPSIQHTIPNAILPYDNIIDFRLKYNPNVTDPEDLQSSAGKPTLSSKTDILSSEQARKAAGNTVIIRQGDNVKGGDVNNVGGSTNITIRNGDISSDELNHVAK